MDRERFEKSDKQILHRHFVDENLQIQRGRQNRYTDRKVQEGQAHQKKSSQANQDDPAEYRGRRRIQGIARNLQHIGDSLEA